jgi:hypothetical protein
MTASLMTTPAAGNYLEPRLNDPHEHAIEIAYATTRSQLPRPATLKPPHLFEDSNTQ